MNMFSHQSPWKPHKSVLKPSEQGLFILRQLIWGVRWLGILSKWTFSQSISMRNMPGIVCWNLQNSVCFYEMIDLRGQMPRFTLKNECFPIYLLVNPIIMCLKTLRTGLAFPRQLIWGVKCQGLLWKWMFSHLSPWKHNKCMLKPSEQGLFFWDNWFEGSPA